MLAQKAESVIGRVVRQIAMDRFKRCFLWLETLLMQPPLPSGKKASNHREHRNELKMMARHKAASCRAHMD
jgi:hypothetical protein